MKEPIFEDRMQLRTTGVSKLALDRIVANLRASGRVRWKSKKVTQEAVINAVWLWLEELDPKEVEDVFARYVPRLEALMRGVPESDLADEPGSEDPVGYSQGRDVTDPPKPRKGRVG